MTERNENEVTLHEKLCAFVLDEAEPEVRAEVEAALESSPELRAERARLEATIGLVQGALAGGSESAATDELSPTAAAALAAAAEARQGRPAPILRGPSHWYRSPVLKVAAGIGAVALAFTAYQGLTREDDVSPFVYNLFGGRESTRVATASIEQTPESVWEEPDLEQLDALGYTDGASSEPRAKTARHEERKRTDSVSSSRDELAEADLDRLQELGFPGGEGDRGALFDNSIARGERAKKDEAQAIRESLPASEKAQERLRGLGYLGTPVDSPASEPASGEALGIERVANEPAAPASGGPSSPGPSGPSTPGAASPGSPAGGPARARRQVATEVVLTGSDDFFLGHGEKGRSRAEPSEVTGADFDAGREGALRALGYAPVDEAPVLPDSEVEDLGRMGYLGERPDARGVIDPEAFERANLQRRLDFVLSSCQRRPSERPRDMFFRFWGDNPFEYTVLDGLSTFSVDVDTASYTLARRYLSEGHLPEKAQVRTEEFVNYFDADVPAPLETTFRDPDRARRPPASARAPTPGCCASPCAARTSRARSASP